MNRRRRIAAHCALMPEGLMEWPLVTLDGDGTVVAVERCEGVDSHYGTEFYSGMLLPGMVNAHAHLELSYLRGRIAEGGGFVRFAEQLTEARYGFSREQMESAAEFWDARMFADGVSAVGDVANSDVTFGLKRRSRVRYHTFLETYGLAAQPDDLAPLHAEAARCGISSSPTPHSTYSLGEAAFERAVDASDGLLSVHFMENREEAELFEQRGRLYEWYAGRGLPVDFIGRYASPADRIIRCVPPSRRILLIHNTFITREDVSALAAHFGDGLTFVLCPRSNRYINDAAPPAKMLLEAGVRVALGTDSLASNTSLSMLDEVRVLCEEGGVSLLTALGWATLAGAQALGVDEQFGSLEAGKRPGIALLEGVDRATMSLKPEAKVRRIV
ncbi:MAG: amidohydrolase family protein [Rikenellaceae bacterium]|nr:amidohydrolase family protein [Rikenellaceae bacterium]MCL2693413.1 amidohydrolase family protein [Rikenellaceae bacterium]